jgi:hypothetical protein
MDRKHVALNADRKHIRSKFSLFVNNAVRSFLSLNQSRQEADSVLVSVIGKLAGQGITHLTASARRCMAKSRVSTKPFTSDEMRIINHSICGDLISFGIKRILMTLYSLARQSIIKIETGAMMILITWKRWITRLICVIMPMRSPLRSVQEG